MKKINILIIGTFPGKIGGTTILVELLYNTLRINSDEWEIEKIDTGKAVYSLLRNGTIQKIFNSDIIIQNVSYNSWWLSYYLSLLFIIFNKKVSIRFFGGDAHRLSFNKNIIPFVRRKVLVLTETRSNINIFSREGFKVFQVSNFRPLPNKEMCKSKPIQKRIIFVGQMKVAKGVKDIIELARSTSDLVYDFFGPLLWDVTEQDFEMLPNTNYKGVVPLGETANLFDNYDALIFPSTYEGESHAGVVIESFSVGLPVICYNWQAITEIVKDGVNGIVTRENTPYGLKESIDRFYRDINHSRMRCNCIKTFNDFHTPNVILLRHKEIIRYLMHESKEEPPVSYLG